MWNCRFIKLFATHKKYTILITGGSTGIGLAIAEALVKTGNEVLICGRRESKLLEAKQKHPQLHIRVCDIGKKLEREALYQWATTEYPNINMLINNAGIQYNYQFAEEEHLLNKIEHEINTKRKKILIESRF